MSKEKSKLHEFVHQRFREVFGTADNTLGRDDHWSLLPHPDGIRINVLVNGSAATPAVWVFDPHDRNDGVIRTAIEREEQVAEVIEQVKQRMQRARERYVMEAG